MSKYPIVLIVSEGQISPKDVVNGIRKQPLDDEVESLGFFSTISQTINGHVFHLKTKYYTTQLYLVPFDEDISLFPVDLLDSIEGVLIYFDSGKRSFSQRIPVYAKFLKTHEIEMGILLCDTLYDDSNEGITYKEAKQESRFLDVIELGRKVADDDDEQEEYDHHDPKGYDELHQALRSVIWSNIDMSEIKPINFPKVAESPTQETPKPIESKVVVPKEGTNKDEKVIEAELEMFEKLLTEMMTFKDQTSNWSRNEKLAYAEKFAHKFDKLLEDCIDSDDEGSSSK